MTEEFTSSKAYNALDRGIDLIMLIAEGMGILTDQKIVGLSKVAPSLVPNGFEAFRAKIDTVEPSGQTRSSSLYEKCPK